MGEILERMCVQDCIVTGDTAHDVDTALEVQSALGTTRFEYT